MNPLHLVCRYYDKINQPELIEYLLLNGADANARASKVQNTQSKALKGFTPLHLLFCFCKISSNLMIEITKFCIENGAEVNAKNKNGETPLHCLCFSYKKENLTDIVRFLIDKGAEINVKSEFERQTPLHLVCYFYLNDQLKDIVRLLIEKGEEVNATDRYGSTPLHWLCRYYHESKEDLMTMVRLFVEKDNDVINARDKNGWTPLHWLCYNYKISNSGDEVMNKIDDLKGLVDFFVGMGADINARNNFGSTPIYLLRQRGI